MLVKTTEEILNDDNNYTDRPSEKWIRAIDIIDEIKRLDEESEDTTQFGTLIQGLYYRIKDV